MRDLQYSLDALIPGIYFWVGKIVLRLGGSKAEEHYPEYDIPKIGFAIIINLKLYFISSNIITNIYFVLSNWWKCIKDPDAPIPIRYMFYEVLIGDNMYYQYRNSHKQAPWNKDKKCIWF